MGKSRDGDFDRLGFRFGETAVEDFAPTGEACSLFTDDVLGLPFFCVDIEESLCDSGINPKDF